VQDGRIHIELINGPFLQAGGTPAEPRRHRTRDLQRLAIAARAGVYVKFTATGAELFA
jgi:hypothetical protein